MAKNNNFDAFDKLLGGDRLKNELKGMVSDILKEAMTQKENINNSTDIVSDAISSSADALKAEYESYGKKMTEGQKAVVRALSDTSMEDALENKYAKIKNISTGKYLNALKNVGKEMDETLKSLSESMNFNLKDAMHEIPDFDEKSIKRYMDAFKKLKPEVNENELKAFENQMYRYKKATQIFNENKEILKGIDYKNPKNLSVEEASQAVKSLEALKQSAETIQMIQHQYDGVFGEGGFKKLFKDDGQLQKYLNKINTNIKTICTTIKKEYKEAFDSIIKDYQRLEKAIGTGDKKNAKIKIDPNQRVIQSEPPKIEGVIDLSDIDISKYLKTPKGKTFDGGVKTNNLYRGLNQYMLEYTPEGNPQTLTSQKKIADLLGRVAQIIRIEEKELQEWLNNTEQINDVTKDFINKMLEVPEYNKLFNDVLNYKDPSTLSPSNEKPTSSSNENPEEREKKIENADKKERESAQETAEVVVESEKKKQKARQETVQQRKENQQEENNIDEKERQENIAKNISDFSQEFNKIEGFSDYGQPEWIAEYIEQIQKGEIDAVSAIESLKNRISEKIEEVQKQQRVNLENNTQAQEFVNFLNGDEEELKKYGDLLAQITSGQIKAQEAIAQVEAERQKSVGEESSETSTDALEQEGIQAESTAKKIEKKNEASEKSLKIAKQIMDLVGATGKNTKNDIAEILDNFNGDADYKKILTLLSKDNKVLKNASTDTLYEQVKNYLKNSKIKFDKSIVSELGDDWRSIVNTIGTKTVTKSGTTDIITTLAEMNDALGTTFDITVSVEDAFRELYEFLSSNKPNSSIIFDEWENSGATDAIKEIIDANNREAQSEKELADAKEERQKVEEKQKDSKPTTSSTTAIESETKAEKESGDTTLEQEKKKQKAIEETRKAREKATQEAEDAANKERLEKVNSYISSNFNRYSTDKVEDLVPEIIKRVTANIPGDAVNADFKVDEKTGKISGQLQYINKETKQLITEVYKWHSANEEVEDDYEGLELVSTRYSDKEIDRIQAQERAQQKLLEIQTKYQAKLSGINSEFSNSEEYKSVKSAIAELSNASDPVAAINKVDTAFNNLNNVINEFKQNVKSTGSLDPVVSALKKFDNVDNIARGFEQSFELMGYSADEAAEKVKNLRDIIERLKQVDRESGTGMLEFSRIMKEFNTEESRINKSIPVEKNQVRIQNQQKSLESKKILKTNELADLISKLDESNKLTDDVILKFYDLRDALNSVFSTEDLSLWNDQLKVFKNGIKDLPEDFEQKWNKILSINDNRSKAYFRDKNREIFDSYNFPPQNNYPVDGDEWTGALTDQRNTDVINQYNQIISKVKELTKARQELAKLNSNAAKNPTIDYSKQIEDVKNKISSLIGDIRELNKNNFIDENKDVLGEDRIEKYADEIEKAELAEKRLTDESTLRVQKANNDKIIEGFNEELNKINQLKDAYTELLRLHSQMAKNPDIDYSDQIKVQEEAIEKLLQDSDVTNALTNQNKFDDNKDILGTKKIEAFKNSVYEATKAQDTFNSKFSDERIHKVNNAISRTTTLMTNLSKSNNVNGFEEYFEDAQEEIEKLNTSLMHGMDLDTYEKKIVNIAKKLESFAGKPTGYDDESIYQDMKNYLEAISHGEVEIKKFDAAKKSMIGTIRSEQGELQTVTIRLNQVADVYERVGNETKNILTPLQQLSNFFKTKFSNLVGYIASFGVFNEIWAQIKQGVSYVRELDTALTEMRKVSDETVQSLKDFQQASFEVAESIGTTAKEISNSTADFMRLGYSLEEAGELASNANIYKNVGDIDIETATDDMVSAMKAFNVEAENSLDIVDKYNEVGNNFAISSAEIGEAMARSSSTLAFAGNTLDESIAMATAMQEILQDASTVGNTLKTLSLRIRGAKTELEDAGESTDDMAESTSKLREQVIALTNVDGTGGFDIMLDENTFKSTYDIIEGIYQVWDDMSDIDQAALLELLAGKNRAQGLSALISNFATAQEALATSMDSDGSALQENERYLDSIDGKMSQLSNNVQEFWATVIDSDTVKTVLDVLSNMVSFATDFVDIIGTAPIVITAIATAFDKISGINLFNGGGRAKKYAKIFMILGKLITHRRFDLVMGN